MCNFATCTVPADLITIIRIKPFVCHLLGWVIFQRRNAHNVNVRVFTVDGINQYCVMCEEDLRTKTISQLFWLGKTFLSFAIFDFVICF